MTRERAARLAFRLLFFLGTAIVLAVVCRQGSSLFAVGLAFILYVIATTVWVRGQHQASVDAATSDDPAKRPWTFPYWASLLAVGVGAVLVVVGVWLNVGTALLAGFLSFYFGAGYALMRFRELGTDHEGRRRVEVGIGVLALSVILVLAGLLFMEHHQWTIWLLVPGLLIAPAGLTVLAEPAVSWLQGKAGRNRWIAGSAAAGAVLLGGSTGIALGRVGTLWILVAFGALAALVLAIVSSTQADIAAVIAAVALMGVTPMSEPKPNDLNPQPGDARVLVALGDSYMSGEGAQIYYEEAADEGEKGSLNRCHRAPTAWAAVAGQTNRLFDSVAFLACSGASTDNVRHQGPPRDDGESTPQFNEPGTQLDQVDVLKKELGDNFNPSLVVLSLGGNDAGFSTIGAMCIAPGDCSDKADLWEETLDQVSTRLTATYKEIRQEFPNAPVLVTAYTAPVYTTTAGEVVKCDQVALSTKDLEFISSFIPKLNDAVARAANEQKFYFLDKMEHALADTHLQLCDPENNNRPGINFIGLRSVAGIAEQRFNPENWYHNSLHPNARGHAAMLQVFEEWRAQNPAPATDNPNATAQNTETSGANDTPLCDLIDTQQSSNVRCRPAGEEWTRGQLSNTFLWNGWGIQIAAAALGAWLLGVAFYGLWKPWWPHRPADPRTDSPGPGQGAEQAAAPGTDEPERSGNDDGSHPSTIT